MPEGILVDRMQGAAGLHVDHHGGVGWVVAPAAAPVMVPATRVGGRGDGRENGCGRNEGRQSMGRPGATRNATHRDGVSSTTDREIGLHCIITAKPANVPP